VAADFDVTRAMTAGQVLGPFTVKATAVDRYTLVTVTCGTGDPAHGGGGVVVVVEATPAVTAWRMVATLDFGLDGAFESLTLLAGVDRYRVTATASTDVVVAVRAERG